MPVLTKPSSAAFLAIVYITLGALIDVWTTIYYLFFRPTGPDSSAHTLFWCAGFFFTGLVLLIIGLAVGRIGREARHAELPPPEVTPQMLPTPQPVAQAAVPPTAFVAPVAAVPPQGTMAVPAPVVPPAPPSIRR